MILGIDIGGTNIKFGVVDNKLHIQKKYSIPTKKEEGDVRFVSDIITKCKEILKEYPVERIGIGTPGTIDYAKGIGIRASNLPYKNTPVVDMLEEALGIKTFLANDATCAIMGEIYAGVGKKYCDFIMITLGTGVGGGVCIDGRPYSGQGGRAGEFGHMTLKYDGPVCRCGRRGCFEQYASITALIAQTKEAIQKHPQSLLAKIGEAGISGRTVFEAYQEGCNVAAEVLAQYTEYIAEGVRDLYRVFAPEAIVIGGAVSAQKENLIMPLREKVEFPVEICTSDLGNDAGIIGAAVVAREGSKTYEKNLAF